MKDKIRVLLVANIPLCYRLRTILAKDDDMEVLGEYSSIEDSLAKIEMTTPDIVILDTKMPTKSGIRASDLLRSRLRYDGAIIMLAKSVDDVLENMDDCAVDYFFVKDKHLPKIGQLCHVLTHRLENNAAFATCPRMSCTSSYA